MDTIQFREVPERTVLREERRIFVDDLGAYRKEAVARMTEIAERTTTVTGPFIVVFHGEVSDTSDGPLEICVPIESSQGMDPAEVEFRSEPAHIEAFKKLTKEEAAWPRVRDAITTLHQWIVKESRHPTGTVREIHVGDWDAAAPTDIVVELAVPIA